MKQKSTGMLHLNRSSHSELEFGPQEHGFIDHREARYVPEYIARNGKRNTRGVAANQSYSSGFLCMGLGLGRARYI